MQISDCYFNDYIYLERPQSLQDTSGGPKRIWERVTEDNIRAAVQPMNVKDILLYEGRQIRVTHNIYIEEEPSFKRGYRLKTESGRIFTIKGVIEYAGTDRVWNLISEELLE